MVKPPYVPPLLHGRISRDGLIALEPRVELAQDFDARLQLPPLGESVVLDLGGVAVRFLADAPAAANEQFDPELTLKGFHLGGDGGLADAQFARRGGKTAALGDGVEGAELGVPHIDFLNG